MSDISEVPKADSPLSAEEAAEKYAASATHSGLAKPRNAFLAGDANGYARAQAEAKEREEKLQEALKEHMEFMQGCRDAAFSNLEGADEKEFIYWNNWATDCIAQIKKIAVALARKVKRNDPEESRVPAERKWTRTER